MQGNLVCVTIYTLSLLLLGASITAGIFVFHAVIVPLLFRYSKSFRRNLIFSNFMQWPLNIDYEDPSACGLDGSRNFAVQFQSKVDKCPVKIGIWHILPRSTYENLKGSFDYIKDKEQLNKLMDHELVNSKTPIVIYLHGNSNNRATHHRVELYKFLQRMDFHTIAFDYRGYGDSSNIIPSEDGVVEDSLMVYDWLKSKIDKGTSRPPIFVWGHSLGTGIASHMLGNLQTLSSNLLDRSTPLPKPNGLILESPFSNLADEISYHGISKLLKWMPYYEWAFVTPFVSCPKHSFRSEDHLARVTDLPILILHSKDDVIVPYEIGDKLYKSVLESRREGGAELTMHSYDKSEGLGHKWICNAKDLTQVVGDFVSRHK